jgi:hypothetical protein
MDAPLESATDEVTRLRDCLNDLVSIMALPAVGTSGEPARIVGALPDALLGTLRLSLLRVRLNDPEGGRSADAPPERAEAIRQRPRRTGRSANE